MSSIVLAALMATAGATGPTAAAEAACAVDYQAYPYTGGFTAGITIRNTGSLTIDGWTFEFPLESGATVAEFYNAVLRSPSGTVTSTDVGWNAVVRPTEAITIGFRAAGIPGAGPAWFAVNGIRCTRAEVV
jgi:hypothetical protein